MCHCSMKSEKGGVNSYGKILHEDRAGSISHGRGKEKIAEGRGTFCFPGKQLLGKQLLSSPHQMG